MRASYRTTFFPTHLSRFCLIGCAALMLAGCGLGDRISGAATNYRAVGLPYDARLDTGETDRDFTVRVEAPGIMLADARESARFPATRHCIETTGSSSVEWALSSETGDWAVARDEDGNIVLSGRCADR